MFRNLKSQKWFWLFLIALIWFLQVAFVQEYTLRPYFTNYFSWIGKHATRWILDFLVILLIVNVFPRRLVMLTMLLSCLFSIVLLTYFDHFHAPLSEQVVLSQSNEASSFGSYVLDVISWHFAIILFVLLGVKLVMLQRARTMEGAISWGRQKIFKLLLVIVPLALVWGVSLYHLPALRHLGSFNKWTIYAETYGYLPAWGMNYYYNRDPSLLLSKAVNLSKPMPDNVAFNIPVKPDNIVIIQFESLDFPMLKITYEENAYVMPYVHSLLEHSLLYKVKYDYSFGTATADFELITGLIPGGERIPYKVEGFPFAALPSLARIAGEKGFTSSAFHGNQGFFYGRENAFTQVGFDHVYFTREMLNDGIGLYKDYVLDRDTFKYALSKLTPTKNLQFIITMTSHGPWDYQPEEENEIYSQPQDSIENYFNAIRYVDNGLKEYVEGLPDNTLIFMFGDHVSAQEYENYELGVVPFVVYQKGQSLRFVNKKERKKAISGEMLRSDLIGGIYNYLRNY